MQSLLRWLGALALLGWVNLCEAREIAVTIDDLPWASESQDDVHEARETGQLLRTLKRWQVPAIGFVNENKLEETGTGQLRPARLQLLHDWLRAGLQLGNHSYSHRSLNQIPLADYQADVQRGEQRLRPLLAEYGQTLQWFRHPFLQTGLDAQTRSGFEAFLQTHHYRIAPVTIDNGEWIYALAYRKALQSHDAEQQARLGADYLDYMLAKVGFFERAAQMQLGRPMPHILLLHANELNARFLDPLLKRLSAQDWSWISLERAAADPAYRTQRDEFFGRGGISWIHRWALTAKQPAEYYRGEPVVSAWVLAAAGVTGE